MWSDVPNLRHLRAFRRVVETRSVSEAARNVHLSQPAVTQAVGGLEGSLGLKLLERGANGMEPTAAGRSFAIRIARALELLRAGARGFLQIEARRDRKGFSNFEQLVTVPQLRALAAVSRTGNFSVAARMIGVSQPSIHRAARDLERLIGVPIFMKSHRGIELTRAAEVLALNVQLAFAEIRQGCAEVSAAGDNEAGTVVIGSMPLARSFIVPETLVRLSRERPGVGLKVVEGPYDDLLHGLRHGDLDLLVGALRDPAPAQDVVEEPLLRDPLGIVARIGHPLFAKRTITREDLTRYPWVVPIEGTPTRAYFDRLIDVAELTGLPALIETSSLIVVRGVLSRTDRLTIISPHQIMHEAGALAPLPIELEGSARRIGFTARRSWRPTAAQQAFIGHLRAVSDAVERRERACNYPVIE